MKTNRMYLSLVSPNMNKIYEILDSGNKTQIKALFLFNSETSPELIRQKFLYWSRYFFPQYFKSNDAPFHKLIDEGNINAYLKPSQFLNIAFRGSAKTTRTKLFIAFAIANDEGHYRRYFKVNSKDIGNAKQSTTDIYNILISRRVKALYPEVFQKTEAKREETMASFTTATGIKMTADTIGTDQRGDIQDENRPDFLWFDDFETRLSLMSAITTHKIWANMDEAITGLSKDGGVVYTCNYISERGNVHKLVGKIKNQIIIPIEENGEPTWDRYTKAEIKQIKESVEDYEGDYLCKPSASKDVYFDRESVDRQVPRVPIDEIAGLKVFKKYDPSHRIGSGHDVAGGVGLDSSTSVFLDFDTLPISVIGTYKNNEIKPDAFAYEIVRQAKKFGENYVGVEKNYGSTIDILKTLYDTSKIHQTQRNSQRIMFSAPLEFGWETNRATKNKMLSDLSQAIEKGIIELNDPDLIAEVRSYTVGDLMDKDIDPRLATRHFDLLVALAIAFQMNEFIKKPETPNDFDYWEYRRSLIKQPNKNPAR